MMTLLAIFFGLSVSHLPVSLLKRIIMDMLIDLWTAYLVGDGTKAEE
jgi:hypothetical protein